jgi:phospholipase/lecithinase/hemolysin
MKTIRLALLLLFVLLACVHDASGGGVVAFGDSLSDMGNRWLKPDKPDITFRMTWVARLAGPSMLNAPDFKPSGLTAFYGGSNYAVGGAGTAVTAQMGGERNGGQSLTQQVTKRYLNPAFNTAGVQKEALHVIVIGANDLMLASVQLDQLASQWTTLDKVGVAVAQSTEGQIQALAAAGVTRVLWGNLFNVAQAPSVVAKSQLLGSAISSAYLSAITSAVLAHNREMDAAIARLEKANPSLDVIKLDLYALLGDIAADPAKYGFVEVTRGANDSRHLFSADGLHPTPKGHQVLAEYAYKFLTSSGLAAGR